MSVNARGTAEGNIGDSMSQTRLPGPALATLTAFAALAACGCAAGPTLTMTPEETAALDPSAPPREIRILTLNVWSGLTYEGICSIGEHANDPEKRYEGLVAGIRELAPDLIALQEANPLPDYALRLAEDLDYAVVHRVALGGFRFGGCGIPTNLREGGAILARKPWTLVDLDRVCLEGGGIATNWFCCHTGEITQAIVGRAFVNGRPLYLVAAHLHSGPFAGAALDASMETLARRLAPESVREARDGVREDVDRRRREIGTLLRYLEAHQPPDAPAILLGDFNTTVESGELDPILAGGRWADSYRTANPEAAGATWDPIRNPNIKPAEETDDPHAALCALHDRHPARIDFVFVRGIPRERILGSRVVLTGKDGVTPSDHYGVLTTLRW